MAQATTTAILSTGTSDELRPADVRDRVRAALEANAAELAARRRWATIYRNGRRPATTARVRTLREALAATRAAA
jgi:hypothetical protein